MDRNCLVRAPHPPFSPDLAPSDFYLFDKVKAVLMEATFEDEDQVFQGVMNVLQRIPRDKLEAVLTSGSLDWTHLSSEPETMLNEGNS
jgi:hypothetical protein